MFGFYGIDIYYLVLVVPAFIFSLWASSSVNGTFKKYSTVYSRRNLTGAQVAEKVLRDNGVINVRIEHISGNLTDHYDSRSNVIRLSDKVYNSTSLSAVGVAAHEAGHALQYAQNYGALTIRNAIIPISNFGSMMAMPLVLIGLIFNFTILMQIGIIFFLAAVIFQIITLPVEFNASSRAVKALADGNILDSDEIQKSKKTLNAAAMTYVAALAVSLAQLLRLIMLTRRR